MGFYSPEVVVNEAKRRGVPVLPVDVNQSRARCTVEASAELKVLSAESVIATQHSALSTQH
jgi:DNA polymerase III alpha subunit